MLLSALKSCGRDDLAAYVKARHEISRRDFIQKTQGTLCVYFIPFIAKVNRGTRHFEWFHIGSDE